MASFKTKVAIVAAAAVIVVGGGTTAVVKLAHDHDSETVEITRQAAPSDASLDPFKQTYALAGDEVVKLVKPPFIPERAALARRLRVPTNTGYSLLLQWDGSGFAIGTRAVLMGQPSDLRNVLFGATGVDRWDLDDPSEILNMPIAGDWVIRKSATRDEIMLGLAKIASVQLGRSIDFEKKATTRQVIVVRAGAAPTTATATPAPDELPWTQHGTVESLVGQLSGATNKQVIDQSGRPRMKVSWRIEQFATVDELLSHVSRQTSLRISIEPRQADLWAINFADVAPLADWRTQFEKTYGLADGEVLKHITPPYGPERRAWWNATRSEHNYDLPAGFTLTFDFDGSPHFKQAVSPGSLDMGLRGCFGDWNDADWFGQIDASIPVGMSFSGDWIARTGATTEQKMAALGPIVSKQLGRPVHFEKRKVSQDVIVARGSVAPPAPGAVIEISPESAAPIANTQAARTTVDRMLRNVGWSVETPVIDETSTPEATVSYRVNGPYDKQVESVLTHIARQTGLTFSREKRDRNLWSLVEATTR